MKIIYWTTYITYWMRGYRLISVSFKFTFLSSLLPDLILLRILLWKQPVADTSCSAAQLNSRPQKSSKNLLNQKQSSNENTNLKNYFENRHP